MFFEIKYYNSYHFEESSVVWYHNMKLSKKYEKYIAYIFIYDLLRMFTKCPLSLLCCTSLESFKRYLLRGLYSKQMCFKN